MDDPNTNPGKPSEAELDRLLHRRKSLSGSEFAGAGMQFAATIVVAALAGIWLDKRLGTSPWLLLLTFFAGAAAGFWSMYRRLVASSRKGP